jgi:uncharacterized protein YdeI (YjbR/CyaY-like superfamily)
MDARVDQYIEIGCGRCAKGATPACSVVKRQAEIDRLRQLVLSTDLYEDLKWGVPCYTINNKNVVIIHAFKDFFALNFFKGALLKDTNGLLHQQTEHTQATRQLRFTSMNDVEKNEEIILEYLLEAIEIEQSGKTIEFKKTSEFEVPEELTNLLNEDPSLSTAFYSLTPGRQRGYLLHFAAPKQSKTRFSRIEKCIPLIMEGKGLHDEYQNSIKKNKN